MVPTPARLRLLHRGPTVPAVRPPFGLAAFDDDDGDATARADVAIALDVPAGWPPSGLGDLDTVVDQTPPASGLAPGTGVVLLGEARRPGGALGRAVGALLGKALGPIAPRLTYSRASVARALRSSALLAQGYVDLGGGIDEATGADLAWGSVPAAD